MQHWELLGWLPMLMFWPQEVPEGQSWPNWVGAVPVESPVIHICLAGRRASWEAWEPSRRSHGADRGAGGTKRNQYLLLDPGRGWFLPLSPLGL